VYIDAHIWGEIIYNMQDVMELDLIARYLKRKANFNIICDHEYRKTLERTAEIIADSQVNLYELSASKIDDIFSSVIESGSWTFLIVNPQSYLKYNLFKYMDFSKGEPVIAGIQSKVLILPYDSSERMFAGYWRQDEEYKKALLDCMKENSPYSITTANGTDLTFISRKWIECDFEICTAPVEESVNGRIVADGALFFRKISEKLLFTIRNGEISRIEALDEAGKGLLAEYIKMTEREFSEKKNLQLAEVGIGTTKGAQITDCFMEAEAVRNTCHFCFGNNVCYGGKNASDFHGASVLVKAPVIKILESFNHRDDE